MNATLTQRKYRLAARLGADTAKTFGITWAAVFIALVVASAIFRQATGEDREFAYYALFAIPLVMILVSWISMAKSYPLALANGLTRQGFLVAFAMFGGAVILATAAFTQLGRLVIGVFSTFRGSSYEMGFYGLDLVESLVNPALFFACGAVAGAVVLRFRSRWLGALTGGLLVGILVTRPNWLWATALRVSPIVETGDMVLIDAPLAVLLALAAWLVLNRAPIPPKRA